jgi:hypothetical protein
MNSKKITFSALIFTLILLVTTIGPTQVGALTRQAEPPDQGVMAALATDPVGSSFLIGDETVDTLNPEVAYNSQWQEYLVVWWNDRAGCDDIAAQRVSRGGAPIGGKIWIANGCPSDRRFPDVAYNSQANEYLVVWEEDDLDIVGQRLSASGGKTGSAIYIASGVPSYPRYYQPVVAYASTENKYLMVFQSNSPTTGYSIIAQALNSDGSDWGTSFEVESLSTSMKYYPDLAYNYMRNEFLVVWSQYNPSQWDIRGRRVKMAGGAGNNGAAFWFSCDSSRDDLAPAVAAVPRSSSSGQYLVAWEYWSNSSNYDIWAQRVSGDGSLEGAAFMVYASAETDFCPAVAGSNSTQQYLVTWTTTLGWPPPMPPYEGIHGRSIATDGSYVDDVTWITGLFADNSSVVSGSAGDMLIAYEDEPSTGKQIWGILLGNRVYLPLLTK